MERNRGDTTAGVLVWTPAPVYSSPSSPEGSDFSWDGEPDEDFQSQMDENGIIGLADSQGQQERGEEEISEELLWDVKTPELECGPHREISLHLSELLDSEPLSQATGDNCRSPTLQDDDWSVLWEDWTDEDGPDNPAIHRNKLISFPKRDEAVEMTDEETNENGARKACQRFMDQTLPVTQEMASVCGNRGSFVHRHRMTDIFQNIPVAGISEPSDQSNCEELKKTNERFLPVSHSSPGNTFIAFSFPHLSSEELMNNCGIEGETFPDLETRTDSSLSSSHSPSSVEEIRRKISPQTSARSPVMRVRLGKTHQDGANGEKLETHLHTPYRSLQPPTPSPRKTVPASCDDQVSIPARCVSKASVSLSGRSTPPTPHRPSAIKSHTNTKTSHTDPDDVRKGQLSHTLPDFSKVEPRVHFPKKSDYKPPKSRRPPHEETSHSDLPVVFKSPAEIVREVLLSSSEGTPGRPSSSGTHERLRSTVPEEFRCPQQASTLVQQLQEDYNRLLTKYAEAENTIDRLRLEAKVGLCSEQPKSSTAVISDVICEGHEVITLSFPQAQRAELGSGTAHVIQQKDLSENYRKTPTRPSSVSSVGTGSLTADHLTDTLTKQSHRFQQQVDAFGALLKSGKLRSCERIKGLSTLAQGQESLEKAYLDARAQYQTWQQRQGRHVTFDPDRDIEGQIFRTGMRLEELKEWLEQTEQNQTISEPPLTPFSPSDERSVSMLEVPESPLSATHPEACVGVEVSSVSGESDADREEEEVLPLLLRPLYEEHKRVEKGFSKLIHHYQSVKELPGMLDQTVTLKSRDFLDSGNSAPPGNNSVTDRQPHRTVNEREPAKSALQQPAADCVPPSIPSVRSQVCDSMETHPEAFCHSSVLPGQPGREKDTTGNRKTKSNSLTSLAESKKPKTIALKAKTKTIRAPPLDGVMSPETDSGFMGSESSQLAPAVHSPLQQRAVVNSIRLSDPHMNTERSESAPPSAQSFAVSPSHSQPSPNTPGEHIIMSGKCTGPIMRRAVEERCSSSSLSPSASPLHWPKNTPRPWPSSLTSQSECRSDEEEKKAQNSKCPLPSNQPLRHRRSPSLDVPYHHGDHLEAQSSIQLTNQQKALQSLHQEVNRLKERLEGSLRLSTPASPVRAPPSAAEDTRRQAHLHTSTPLRFDLRSSERRRREGGGNGENIRINQSKPVLRQRSASLPRRRPETDLTSDSEHVHSEPQPSTSRYVPVFPLKTRGRRQTREFGRHKEDSRSDRSENSSKSEPSQGPKPVCPHCISNRASTATRPMMSRISPHLAQPSCSHCPLCGALQATQRVSRPANRESASTPSRSQPMRSSQRDRGGVAVAPPPILQGGVPVVPYVPVFPSAFYISSPVTTQAYSQPFNISTSPTRGERSGVRGHRRRSLSVDRQSRSLNSSLTHAITVARNMRTVSQHMARSLSSGLNGSSFLSTSCTY